MKSLFLIAAGLLPSSAFASAAMEELHEQTLSIGDQTTTCIEFTGTWNGSCETRNLLDPSAAPQTNEETMTFKQIGCSTLISESFGVASIGTVTTKSTSSERGAVNALGATYWQDGGQKLGMDEQYTLVLHGDTAVVRKVKSTGTFLREGDVIVGAITNKIQDKNAAGELATTVHEESACRLALQAK